MKFLKIKPAEKNLNLAESWSEQFMSDYEEDK